jgi:GST-like protein
VSPLAAFAVTRRWPPRHPERLQLYSMPTPNGVKVSIMLEEVGLPYEAHRVSFDSGDQRSEAFRALNPNAKIPAILDPHGPNGRPLALWESGAILVYLAEKTGRLLAADAAAGYETLQWLMFQMGGIGPMFGQVGFYGAGDLVGFGDFANVKRALDAFLARPAVQRGLLIPAAPA